MLRIPLIMIDKEMGYVHLLEEAFVRTDEVEEFLEAFSTYGGAARLIVNVDGESFESLLTIFPIYKREGLYISQSQTPISHVIGAGEGRFIPRADLEAANYLLSTEEIRMGASLGLTRKGRVYYANISSLKIAGKMVVSANSIANLRVVKKIVPSKFILLSYRR